MSHPRPPSTAHEAHDELLVARLAGGDALEPGEHATASALVTSCPDCARLASDIVAISRAVATEAVPQRRRDFRLSPERAAELRGSPLRRLLRRVTLSSGGGALKPLASGALSIGLVLVFVGSVIPRPQAELAAAPPVPQVQMDALRASDDVAAATPVVKASGGREESDTIGGEPPANDEQPAADTLGDASGTMAMEMAPVAEPQATSGPATAPQLAADGAPDGAAQSLERAMSVPSPARFGSREADAEGAPDERADIIADGQTDQALEDGGAAVASDASGLDVGLLLVVTGIALVAVGIVLLLLLILSRRHPDALQP